MLSVVQAISAQVGMVMNTGLEAAVRRRYGKGWALLALVSVLIVNLITLAADLEGGGAALSLLIHIDYRWFVIPLAASVRDSCSFLVIIKKSTRAHLLAAGVSELRRRRVYGATAVERCITQFSDSSFFIY
jgi:Mn2+/Fe2+ NRAMP family transporter